MASPSGYPAPLGPAPLVAGAIQAAVGKTVPQTTPEAGPPCEEQAADAEGACAAGADVTVSDKMMERLMQSMSDMEADYARTVAATLAPVEPGVTLGGDDRDCAMAEDGADASSHEDEDTAGGGGYQMIGSDGGSSNADLDDVEDSAPAPEAAGTGWPQADDLDFQDFQGNHLENFADFGASNPLLPAPPEGLSLWAATPLTDIDVQFIKDTMKLVEPTPPAWAKNLPDGELQRKVRELLRST